MGWRRGAESDPPLAPARTDGYRSINGARWSADGCRGLAAATGDEDRWADEQVSTRPEATRHELERVQKRDEKEKEAGPRSKKRREAAFSSNQPCASETDWSVRSSEKWEQNTATVASGREQGRCDAPPSSHIRAVEEHRLLDNDVLIALHPLFGKRQLDDLR